MPPRQGGAQQVVEAHRAGEGLGGEELGDQVALGRQVEGEEGDEQDQDDGGAQTRSLTRSARAKRAIVQLS